MMKKPVSGFVDFLWVIALMVFVFAGMPEAVFHGDEAMQIYMSNDYWTLTTDEDLEALMVEPPYEIDSDGWLRLLNGSVNRYAIGAAWEAFDLRRSQLPERPGWDWGLDYAKNVTAGNRPDPEILNISRIPSTLFLALTVPIMYVLGRAGGGRVGGFVASGLFALDPVILLNGRRAMQEGAMLFFGLATVMFAAAIASQRAQGRNEPGLLWWLLTIAGGLALASKHSAVVFVGGALAWILAGELLRFNMARVIAASIRLAFTAVTIGVIFFAVSPTLWSNPIDRFSDLLNERAELINLQAELYLDQPMTMDERQYQILNQPFVTPVQYYEVASWGNDADVQAEIARYEASAWSGIHWAETGTIPLTLALIGSVSVVYIFLSAKERKRRVFAAGILVLTTAVIASLLVNPLPWQRYYLAEMGVACILAAIGVGAIYTVTSRMRSEALTTPAGF
jgi:4-amino-4-deoxy-L-arabinose transferase-like glycosyltransferase